MKVSGENRDMGPAPSHSMDTERPSGTVTRLNGAVLRMNEQNETPNQAEATTEIEIREQQGNKDNGSERASKKFNQTMGSSEPASVPCRPANLRKNESKVIRANYDRERKKITSGCERKLKDVIDLAAMYSNHRSLTTMDPGCDKDSEYEAARELATIGLMTPKGAQRVLSMLNIRKNKALWKYFEEHRQLRVFSSHDLFTFEHDERHFDMLDPKVMNIIASPEPNFCGDERLNDTLVRMESSARDVLVLWMFEEIGVIGTLCGWCRCEVLSVHRVQDILRRYLCSSWNTADMSSQTDDVFSARNMGVGWNAVMIATLHLLRDILEEERPIRLLTEAHLRTGSSMTKMITLAFCEFLAWAYQLLGDQITASDFVSIVSPLGRRVITKMHEEMKHPQQEERETTTLFDKWLPNVLQLVDDGKLTARDNVVSNKPTAALLDDSVGCRKRRRSDEGYGESHLASKRSRAQEEDGLGEIQPQLRPEQLIVMIPETPIPEPAKPKPSMHNLRKSARSVNRALRAIPLKNLGAIGRESVEGSTRTNRVGLSISFRDDHQRHDGNEITNEYNEEIRPVPVQDEPAPNPTESFPGIMKGWAAIQRMKEGKEKKADELIEDVLVDVKDAEEREGDSCSSDDDDSSCDGEPPGIRKLNKDVQEFQAEILSWNTDADGDQARNNLLDGNAEWYCWYADRNEEHFHDDVTKCEGVISYSTHWKHMMTMESRGQIHSALLQKWPMIQEDRSAFHRTLHGSSYASPFTQMVINKVSKSRLLTNIKCESVDVRVNQKIVNELCGGSMALGFMERHGRRSGLILVMIRSVHINDEDRDQLGLGGRIDKLTLSAAINRKLGKSFSVHPGDLLHVQHFFSYSPVIRMFVAAHMTYSLPPRIQNTFFGPNAPSLLPEHRKVEQHHDVRPLYESVHPGCREYVFELSRRGIINLHQFEAMMITLSQISDAGPKSPSISMIQGPPGTGKTTSIVNLIGALVHHSQYGHVGEMDRHNQLKREDGILRSAKKKGAVKILVTAGSNQAVDNVMRALDRGVPDGKGGFIKIQAVRLARRNYDFKDIKKHSINEKALPFDHELFNKPDSGTVPRTSASSRARRALGDEAIVFFSTNVLAGGSSFLDLKQEVDFVINDEVSTLLEAESLIPMTTTRKRSSFKRLHYVGVGDFAQLYAVSPADQQIRLLRVALGFSYVSQTRSQFERLFKAKRIAVAVLMTQYRMHYVISTPHSQLFYNAGIDNGLSAVHFMRPYNQRKVKGTGYFPLTFIDTSYCKSRRETDKGDGKVSNNFEARIVHQVINKLISEMPSIEAGSSSTGKNEYSLRGRIAVVAPYRSQVDEIRDTLTQQLMQQLDIVVDTVDYMQGAERDVVIFSCTRSNHGGIVGFLTNKRRLNVAVSRARTLLVIIGDAEHLYSIAPFRFFIKWCRDGKEGAGILRVPPGKGDEVAQPPTRGGSMNFYRRRSEYGLRPRTAAPAPKWLQK